MKLIHLGVAGVLATAASLSFAQEAAPIALTLNPIAAGTLRATFQGNVSGIFVDTFAFTPPSVAGNVSVTFAPVAGPVTFYSALLNGEGFSQPPDAGMSNFSFQSMVSADMPLSLTVLGFAGDPETLTAAAGTYSATIEVQSVAAIPEPQTYALMLAGLGALAWMRRRTLAPRWPRRVG